MASGEEVAYIGVARLLKYDGVWYPDFWMRDRETLSSMSECDFGDNDILVCTYPKSGTGWLLRILSLMVHDVDVDKTNSLRLHDQLSNMLEKAGVQVVMATEKPRIIKTHMAYGHIPRSFRQGKGKIIYLTRNPKDVCVSYYFFLQMINHTSFNDSFDVFFDMFMKGIVSYGLWSKHVKEFWSHRNDENILVINYEDMHQNLEREISKIATFCGKKLTPEQIDTIAKESSFNNMAKNEFSNFEFFGKMGFGDHSKSKYMRKGVIGDWKNYFTAEMNQKVDDMIQEDIRPLGLNFIFE